MATAYSRRCSIGSAAKPVWVPAAFLDEQKVSAWSDMPVWIPAQGDTAGASLRSNARAMHAGLAFRPLGTTAKETLVLGRALGGLFWFVFSQIVLFAIGIAFFGLRLRLEIVYALPAMVLAAIALIGIAHLLAGVVLVMREANLFIDCTNFLFAVASGAAFPVTLLPGVLQPLAFALPTTYAMDILRQQALGTRPLFDPALEYVALIAGTAVLFPIGLWVYRRAERRIRRLGTINQY